MDNVICIVINLIVPSAIAITIYQHWYVFCIIGIAHRFVLRLCNGFKYTACDFSFCYYLFVSLL